VNRLDFILIEVRYKLPICHFVVQTVLIKADANMAVFIVSYLGCIKSSNL